MGPLNPVASGPDQVASGLVDVSYRTFYVVDDSGNSDVAVIPPAGEIVAFIGHGITVTSACQNHTASVRMELWNTRPTAVPERPGGSWEVQRDLTMDLQQGPLLVRGLFGDRGPSVDLLADNRYRLRLYCGGRRAVEEAWQAEVDRLDVHADDGIDYPVGVEQYVIQVWPNPDAPTEGYVSATE